jgi:FkbH-like protein
MSNFLALIGRGDSVPASARLLRTERGRLVKALISGDAGARINRFAEPADVFEQRVGESLELLRGHVEGRPHFDALYAGQRLFELHRPELDRATNLRASRLSVEHDRQVLLDTLSANLTPKDLLELGRAYDSATIALCSDAKKHVRTLFIGDCLMVEIMAFLVGPLLSQGISIDAFPINSRDVGQLRDTIASLADQSFDVVFFSPFSHARLPEIEALLDPGRTFGSTRGVEDLADAIVTQTKSLLDFLADRFECPIYVHNASLTVRSTSAVKAAASAALLARPRVRAKERINQWLNSYVTEKNAATFPHLFVLDEALLAQEMGTRAGRLLHESPFQHATVLSQALASEYGSRIDALATLMGKKLVVCDLDNTLWKGLIGEGNVEHFLDKQKVLQRLKVDGGIVLSIASKNDPANVRFDGGILREEDFVAFQISWGPKTQAIDRIRKQLNLQTRHMVFLDDRPDERALVADAFPDMLVMDACDEDVWTRLELWAGLIQGSSDLDRTKLYREQLQRDALAQTEENATTEPERHSLEKLGLKFTLSEAKRGDLKRVAELINRTNQWNMCGTRTTFEQVRKWSESTSHHIVLGAASDRFGDMGTVCVAVLAVDSSHAEIPVFVLSCRVFGYGVETAMLAELTRRCAELKVPRLVGRFLATGQNHPGKDMYRDHGFESTGGDFARQCTTPMPSVAWAEVRIA